MLKIGDIVYCINPDNNGILKCDVPLTVKNVIYTTDGTCYFRLTISKILFHATRFITAHEYAFKRKFNLI